MGGIVGITGMKVQDRAAGIDRLTAGEAIATWLEGDYRCGDDWALLGVIRRDARTALSDPEIRDLIHEASERGWAAEVVLARLTRPASAEGRRGAGELPR